MFNARQRDPEVDVFFHWSDEQLVDYLLKEYGNELARLTRAYSIRSPEDDNPNAPESPSQIALGQNYDEVNRTLTSVFALRWLYNDDYETFVQNQPKDVKLTRNSFKWLRNIVLQGIQTPQDLFALVMSVIVNDLGKDPELAADYRKRTGKNVSHLNHDMILLLAVREGLVPCLNRLPSAHKADIIRGMELGAEYNFGQLAQAEAPPVCLERLRSMSSHERAFDVRFQEQLLDIAGAAGHMDWTCAKKMIEPICIAYRDVYDASKRVITSECNLPQAYDLVLERRAQRLSKLGFRLLAITDQQDRALCRLLCMGGVANSHTAQLYETTWVELEEPVRAFLVTSLNAEGSTVEPAMQPTYMPALLTRGLAAAASQDSDKQKEVLHIMFQYLARVLEMPGGSPSVSVLERNLLFVVKAVPSDPDFIARPDILLGAGIPKAEIARA
ncbi:hypothetical protein C7974DRAFT_458918 [Boeremia exigua]|uniref:uncharacterized protein n=1 Tax=Boeremia exigua TaxID=749465 RepID=UPI001E8E3388|nr:uncharacterized protein C7974DRAFT_458918 [Boeremia exigua]KAH6620594.1 hypothetical protein C7974DRAFT_458918 [Boeremia exigua]